MAIEKSIAHPKALELLKDDFYWDCGNESAPFGSDEGSDCFDDLCIWKDKNPTLPLPVIKFINSKWNEYKSYTPEIDIRSTNLDNEKHLMWFCETLDEEIIAIGFGQIVIEGKIGLDVKDLTLKAIQRQLSKECSYHRNLSERLETERIEILEKEREVLNNYF